MHTKGRERAMKESITNNKIVTLIIGALFIGGLVAIVGMYRSAKDDEHPPFYV
jgi:hypothetical protein